MKNNQNIKRIIKLLKDHYSGKPWIDITTGRTLKSLSAKQASAKYDGLNSIWEIVNHIISWRKALTGRVKDRPVPVPDDNFFSPVKDSSPAAWKKTVVKYELSQKEIMSFLSKSDDSLLENISPVSGYSYYELVISIIIHDTYHLGQIILIKKLLGK